MLLCFAAAAAENHVMLSLLRSAEPKPQIFLRGSRQTTQLFLSHDPRRVVAASFTSFFPKMLPV